MQLFGIRLRKYRILNATDSQIREMYNLINTVEIYLSLIFYDAFRHRKVCFNL
jgi:hypothetical protein